MPGPGPSQAEHLSKADLLVIKPAVYNHLHILAGIVKSCIDSVEPYNSCLNQKQKHPCYYVGNLFNDGYTKKILLKVSENPQLDLPTLDNKRQYSAIHLEEYH